ncbi:MAG: penicillin-binding protein 2 [Rhodospirillaceae bacterium]|nr:penicillin-binding protein 2 [Rhodospirillales bacterium]
MSFFAPKPRIPGFHAGDDLGNTPAALRLDGVRTQALETSRGRLVATAIMFLAAFGLITVRMIDVAVLDSNPAKPRALPTARTEGLDMERADITDRNGVILATSLPTVSLYAKGLEILDSGEAAAKLVSVLPDLNKADIQAKLAGGKQFVWLRRNLTPRQQYDVNALGIPGLYFEKGERRVYPHGNLAAHIVGMTDIDNKGIAGIEKRFDQALRGGHEPVKLSIDVRLQTVVRNELMRSVAEFKALGALGTVLDVHTGEIVAMVSLPDYDPNDPPAGQSEALFNRATKGAYEMGSTMKLFNTAMAIESGKFNINSNVDCTKPLVFAGHTIHDDHPMNRWASVSDILVHSSNIGSARMALEAGTEFQRAFMGRIGMLHTPALELPEVGGPLVPNPWREINTVTISFGHGLSVTPLQLVQGASTLVNGGIFHPMTLLAKNDNDPIGGERVIKAKTSDQVRSLMRMVVTEGTGKKADVPGYDVGGKTGTAEKAVNGSYKKKAVLSSFVAAFPMDNPRYVVLASIDEPQGTKETYGFITAGWTAAPTAGRIIAQVAPLMGLMPKAAPMAQGPGKGTVAGNGGNVAAVD